MENSLPDAGQRLVSILITINGFSDVLFEDIIGLIVLGAVLMALFIAWQYFLERTQERGDGSRSFWTPPPVIKLSLWSRGSGKFAAMMIIVNFTFASFLGWSFWVTVSLFVVALVSLSNV